ncbi:MAG: DUF349 domain-containing protein [Bacteroides sp.]|nr:DUF349 domain-containing protein [Bacteroides sp.]
MMDAHDTNLPLEQGKLEEDKKVLEATENTPEASDTETREEGVTITLPATTTKEEVISRLKELEADVNEISRQELEGLKQTFYKLHNAELDTARKAFVENGGAEEEFQAEEDPLESEFKALMSSIRDKRNQKAAEQEKVKEENLTKKLTIIERLKEILAQPEDANKYFNEVRQLQQQWNEIKQVPQGKVNELWKNFQHYVEQFYDILKINKEFRDYDFKKNLELKTNLCIAAEKLADESDVISAFYQLQKLHQEYRDTGPVAKEQREEIWTRFKAASTAVNRRHQQHFETMKEAEQRNLDEKTVICEIVEAIDYNELTGFSAWENKTQEVIALQNKWKTIGFAPQKMNVKIFKRFRGACDVFFQKKADFYKAAKEKMNSNLEKKRELCEKVESLKESTDWKETADILTKLQKEWKTIGPVPKKYSDSVWKRFISACDYFFEQKNKATSSQRSVEVENLEKKKDIIARLSAIGEDMETEEAVEKVRELMKEWSSVGHVPFREKDKIYKEYHDWIDKHFERYNMSASQRKLDNFRSSIGSYNKGEKGSSQSIYRERERLVRIYENMKSEIQTYENNLGFLTSSSKKGNSLVSEITRKVEKLKADLELTLQKIKVIDESIREEQ